LWQENVKMKHCNMLKGTINSVSLRLFPYYCSSKLLR